MFESKLTSAQYYRPVEESPQTTTPVDSVASPWERLTSRMSLIVGAALVLSVMILAIGYYSAARDRVSARAKKSTHPLDWMLWFGGAKEDETFEKFLKDTAEKSKQEWDERYRESPAYQNNFREVDWDKVRANFETSPTLPQPARPSTRTPTQRAPRGTVSY